MTLNELKAYKRKAKAQRDNWKKRAQRYEVALLIIINNSADQVAIRAAEEAFTDVIKMEKT